MYTDRIIVYSPTANRIINSVIIPTSQQKAIQQAQKQAEAPVVTTPAVKK
jgi:hypothetical protein